MTRKSSIHFKPVSNVRFATSHSERTDLSEPSYLLPKEHQLGNVIVSGSLSENEIATLFVKQKEGMSRQAKTAGASPFWEGVVVLPNTNGKEQEANLKTWQKAYEKATGHKVLHMAIHLDEGYIDSAGKPRYNPHAHVILSRMDAQNRVIHLDRKQLATVQDLTAESLQMERGSTLEERQGKRGRKHIPHAEFRGMEDAKRQGVDTLTNHIFEVQQFNIDLLDEKEKEDDRLRNEAIDRIGNNVQATDRAIRATGANLGRAIEGAGRRQHHRKAGAVVKTAGESIGRIVPQIAFHAAVAAYAKEHQALKESGEAKQADYQKLKREHEAKMAELKAAHVELASTKEELVKANEKALKSSQNHKAEIEKLKADYAKERQALKESGEAKQADYQELKRQHEAALVELKQRSTAPAVVTAESKGIKTVGELKPVEPPKPMQVPDPLDVSKERLCTLIDAVERGEMVLCKDSHTETSFQRIKNARASGFAKDGKTLGADILDSLSLFIERSQAAKDLYPDAPYAEKTGRVGGRVAHVTVDTVVLNVPGTTRHEKHRLSDLNTVPMEGHFIDIVYQGGQGRVKDYGKSKGRDSGGVER